MKKVLFISSLIAFVLVSCQAQKKYQFNFDMTNLSDWTTHITGYGPPCKWQVIKDENNNVLAQLSEIKKEYRFNIIVNDKLQMKDVEVNVKMKGVKGSYDQGGGPVWRYQDENNYYVARANPLENNFRVYKVVNGNRKQLKSANAKLKSNEWYNIKIVMKGNNIKCYLNGELKMEVNDNTFDKAGKIGLWTKSDAVTYFDNLVVTKWQ